jgi:hypothetical protein
LVEVGRQQTEFLIGQFRTLAQLLIYEQLLLVLGVSRGLNIVRTQEIGMVRTLQTELTGPIPQALQQINGNT